MYFIKLDLRKIYNLIYIKKIKKLKNSFLSLIKLL